MALLLAGCASPGEPAARAAPVPEAVADLTAQQSGNDVILTFTLPKETVEHRPLKQPPAIEIYRGIGAAGPAPLLVTIPSAMTGRYIEQGRFRYADSLDAAAFRSLPSIHAVYSIRTRASEKKASAASNAASLVVYPAPEPIADLKAELTPSGVRLQWAPPQRTVTGSPPSLSGYHIYRAELASEAQPAAAAPAGGTPQLKAPLAQIAAVDSPEYEDAQVQLGKSYAYAVRSVSRYPEETLESGDSALATIAFKDIFPPARPAELVAVLVPAQGGAAAYLELSWAISTEGDIAGYNIYRSEQAGVLGTRWNAEILQTPAFRDMNVQPGHRYFYSVTAVDRAQNESPASAPVEAGVPGEAQP